MTDHEELSFTRVLIANRGEIAVRVIRACREAGITSIACFAESDKSMPFVRLADMSVALGGRTAAETYLSHEAVLAAAIESGAQAIHPGYGFLSEDADFAKAVQEQGLVWIGPDARSMRLLSDKVSARKIAAEVGAPLVAGTDDPVGGPDDVVEFARQHGLPVAIKAAFGGGGRGLKVAHTEAEIPELFLSAVREAEAAFGRGECFVERYLERSRHVEAQILADQHGGVIVVGTRDCSLQRRHQKLVEEAPAPFLTESQREAIYRSSKAICRRAGYYGAGTVEYLLGEDGTLSFLEVNTRLQVEHPVSEETTGLDLVREQFRIASGLSLALKDDPPTVGHSIEFRINGEDAGRGFLPAPGVVSELSLPSGPGVRVDSGVEQGSEIGGQFDSLLAKIIVTGADRTEALKLARVALAETVVGGIATVLPFHRAILEDPAFIGSGEGFGVHTRWIETEFDNQILPFNATAEESDLAAGFVQVPIAGRYLRVQLPGLPEVRGEVGRRLRDSIAKSVERIQVVDLGDDVVSPMQGTVIKLAVVDGDQVEAGDMIGIVEAMKMENMVRSHKGGTVRGVEARVGDSVRQNQVLCSVTGNDDDDDGILGHG